jgi:hypothetical protein
VTVVFLQPSVGEAEGMEGVDYGFVLLAGYGPTKGVVIFDFRFAILRFAIRELFTAILGYSFHSKIEIR